MRNEFWKRILCKLGIHDWYCYDEVPHGYDGKVRRKYQCLRYWCQAEKNTDN